MQIPAKAVTEDGGERPVTVSIPKWALAMFLSIGGVGGGGYWFQGAQTQKLGEKMQSLEIEQARQGAMLQMHAERLKELQSDNRQSGSKSPRTS
jgi:hypothetical protein